MRGYVKIEDCDRGATYILRSAILLITPEVHFSDVGRPFPTSIITIYVKDCPTPVRTRATMEQLEEIMG